MNHHSFFTRTTIKYADSSYRMQPNKFNRNQKLCNLSCFDGHHVHATLWNFLLSKCDEQRIFDTLKYIEICITSWTQLQSNNEQQGKKIRWKFQRMPKFRNIHTKRDRRRNRVCCVNQVNYRQWKCKKFQTVDGNDEKECERKNKDIFSAWHNRERSKRQIDAHTHVGRNKMNNGAT